MSGFLELSLLLLWLPPAVSDELVNELQASVVAYNGQGEQLERWVLGVCSLWCSAVLALASHAAVGHFGQWCEHERGDRGRIRLERHGEPERRPLGLAQNQPLSHRSLFLSACYRNLLVRVRMVFLGSSFHAHAKRSLMWNFKRYLALCLFPVFRHGHSEILWWK